MIHIIEWRFFITHLLNLIWLFISLLKLRANLEKYDHLSDKNSFYY
jgi:hypothetical protein